MSKPEKPSLDDAVSELLDAIADLPPFRWLLANEARAITAAIVATAVLIAILVFVPGDTPTR